MRLVRKEVAWSLVDGTGDRSTGRRGRNIACLAKCRFVRLGGLFWHELGLPLSGSLYRPCRKSRLEVPVHDPPKDLSEGQIALLVQVMLVQEGLDRLEGVVPGQLLRGQRVEQGFEGVWRRACSMCFSGMCGCVPIVARRGDMVAEVRVVDPVRGRLFRKCWGMRSDAAYLSSSCRKSGYSAMIVSFSILLFVAEVRTITSRRRAS